MVILSWDRLSENTQAMIARFVALELDFERR